MTRYRASGGRREGAIDLPVEKRQNGVRELIGGLQRKEVTGLEMLDPG